MLRRNGEDPASTRVGDVDRHLATEKVESLAARGIIRGQEELEMRKRKIRLATNQLQIDGAFAGLESAIQKPKKGDLRASAAQKADALRKIEAHTRLGHLSQSEASSRSTIVESALTPNDLAIAFEGLPKLKQSGGGERHISHEERVKALAALDEALEEHRIDASQYLQSKEQVTSAFTRGEIQAAFHGLPDPTSPLNQASQFAAQAGDATKSVARGGVNRLKAFALRATIAVSTLFLALILLIAGQSSLAALAAVVSVVVFFLSIHGLITGRALVKR